jgi:hypothetical protein
MNLISESDTLARVNLISNLTLCLSMPGQGRVAAWHPVSRLSVGTPEDLVLHTQIGTPNDLVLHTQIGTPDDLVLHTRIGR